MMDLGKFDYEFLLKSYSVQDLALEQSLSFKEDDFKSHAELLKQFKQVKKETWEIDHERKLLYLKLKKRHNIKKSLNMLQKLPHDKITLIQNDNSNLQKSVSRDSDDFVKSVKLSMKKFLILGNEFNDEVVSKNSRLVSQKTQELESNITGEQAKFIKLNEDKTDYDQMTLMRSLNKSRGKFNCAKVHDVNQQLQLLYKNIDFLKQRNAELLSQKNALTK